MSLSYRNDDGGAGFVKDSRLTFDPPADGAYLVRVEDVRGLGGAGFGYHLVIRRPRPDFKLTVSPENPNVPRGGTALVTATIERIDGFAGPVDVTIEGLPPGVAATGARIEAGSLSASLALSADASAPAFSPPTWRAVGRSGDDSGAATAAREQARTFDPGGPRAGMITVTPAPNLAIAAAPGRVEIAPGGGRRCRCRWRAARHLRGECRSTCATCRGGSASSTSA